MWYFNIPLFDIPEYCIEAEDVIIRDEVLESVCKRTVTERYGAS